MPSAETLTVSNTTTSTPPRVPFQELGKSILGPHYRLSIALVGERRSRTLNRSYRAKDKPTNVLAFPLEKNEGELVLTPNYIKQEAPRFNRSYRAHLAMLVIHGLLHLKGHRHGSRMEQCESYFAKRFNIAA